MQTDAFTIRESQRARDLFALWAQWIVVVIMLLWQFADGTGARYVLYLLPPLLIVIHLALNRFRPQLQHAGLIALALYTVAVLASLAINPGLGAYTQRDLLIVFGYILVFCLYMEAPAATADVVLLGLIGALAIEAYQQGISTAVDFTNSVGILESPLAFPLGVVLIYYLKERRWGRALIAGIFFFVAFKRIAMLGVMAAFALDFLTRRRSPAASRRIFFAVVVFACLAALFSTQVFAELGNLVGITSTNQVSLGRYDIAEELWTRWRPGGLAHHLFGFGPGAADAWLVFRGIEANPHNDWLKILFDYGAFGLVLMQGVLAALFPKTRLGNKLYLYSAILMVTDNTFIYMFHFAVVFLISRISPTEKPVQVPVRPWPALGQQAL